MRKSIVLLYMLVFMAIYGLAQNENSKYYYYYKNEKQLLELNTDFVFVSVIGNEDSQNNELFNVGEGILKKEGLSEKIKGKLDSSEDFYWAEIKFGENTTNAIYNEKLTALKRIKNLQTVSPYFKSQNSKKIGLTNFFYVKLKTITDVALLEQYAKQTNSIIVKQDEFMPLWYVLSCTKKSDKNALGLANQFFESGLFQYAEPDLMLENILNCVNDTYFPQQWGLRNIGQYVGNMGIDIRACDAWTLSTGANVNVAVVDQGIQLNHPDLQANIHSLSYDTENGASPSIVRGDHGTACAGIIGAVGNTAGIRGVAPDCRLMSVSNTLNLGTPNIRQKLASGINWAVQNGAHVISNSWGHNDLVSSYINDAITNALTNGRNGLGCVVVFATGNENGAVLYPANSNPNILAVGAISQCGQRKSPTSCDNESTWGSNFGATLDAVAPGVLIPTTDRTGTSGYNPNIPIHILNNGNRILADYTNNDYTVWFNGTSSACPHVAGVAALLLSANPSLTGRQVRDIIEQTAQKVGGYNYTTTTGRTNGTWHNEMGYGLVNAQCAVQNALVRLASISGPSLVCSSGNTFTITGSVDSIVWTPGPGLTITSQNTTSCTVSVTGSGSSWVRATAVTNCETIPLAQKDVWRGAPVITGISGPTTTPNNMWASYLAVLASSSTPTEYNWILSPLNGNYVYNYGNSVTISFYNWGYYRLQVQAKNACTGAGYGPIYETTIYVYDALGLAITPNPATGEATIRLVGENKDAPVALTEWDCEIYDPMQSLKEKKTKLKTIETKINISGWMDGVYIVRAKVGDKILSEKLVVKH